MHATTTSISIATIAISALVSIATGYAGAMLNTRWQRRQDRRTYGLALLAEVKSIQRGLWRYRALAGRPPGPDVPVWLRPELGAWRHDMSVYGNNSGRIGLFSTRTAMELIEFYHRARWLNARLSLPLESAGADGDGLAKWIADHDEAIRRTLGHGRYVARLLLREVPSTWSEIARGVRRRRRRRGTSRRASTTPRLAVTVAA